MRQRLSAVFLACILLLGGDGGNHALAASPPRISADEACSIVNQYFPVGPVLNSRLVDPVEPGTNPAWNLTFDNGSNALIDAVTGRITRFSSVPNEVTANGNLSHSAARQVALDLISRMYPERLQWIVPDPVRPSFTDGAALTFLFTRVVNGALFPANGFRVSVNPNGSIAQFQTSWDETSEFPPVTDVIGQRSAISIANKLLTDNPKVFLFYRSVARGKPPKLFYLVKTAAAEVVLDAQTGTLVAEASFPGKDSSLGQMNLRLALGVALPWILSLALTYIVASKRAGSRASAVAKVKSFSG